MGILQKLGLTKAVDAPATASTADPILWGTSAAGLDPEVAAAFGYFTDPATDVVSRREAMRIPAVRRGRNVICATIALLPLVQLDPAGAPRERTLWTQPDPRTTRLYVLAWLVDDLLFNGVAWLRVTGRDVNDWPATVERVQRERIRIHAGRAYVDGLPVEDRDLIRIDGPDEGILLDGGPTLRTLILLNQAARRFAKLDVPLGLLRLVEGAPELSRDQINTMLDDWEDARRQRTTAYLNGAVTYEGVELDADRIQLTDGRQYGVAEVARLMNLPPRALNAATASPLTYSTSEGERRDLLDMSLSPYLEAIAQRFCLSDVCPPGDVVKFDPTNWLTGTAAEVIDAGVKAIGAGIYVVDEVRDQLGKAPL